MKIQIETNAAPDPVGAYSQAVRIGDTLQVSGQVGIDPHTESLVGGTVYAQTLQALRNVQAILTAAGADFEDVLMLRVFLNAPEDLPNSTRRLRTTSRSPIRPARPFSVGCRPGCW